MRAKAEDIDTTTIINSFMPESWKCPHCGRKNDSSDPYANIILLENFKLIRHCESCGALHEFNLVLTDDFKQEVVDMMKGMMK